MSLPELQQNPLVQRVIDIFDADGNGEVDFKEFIHGVSQFSVKGDKLSKLKFAFRIYDMDNDGFISNGELFQVSISSYQFTIFIYLSWNLCSCLVGNPLIFLKKIIYRNSMSNNVDSYLIIKWLNKDLF